MATYKNEYTQEDLEEDAYGLYVRVQHSLGKQAPLQVSAAQSLFVEAPDRKVPYEIRKLHYVSNNRLHIYPAGLGETFKLHIRVSD